MVDCIQAAKAFIAKEIIRNPVFIDVLETITAQIELLKKLPSQPWVVRKLEYYDEALQNALYASILDLPRTDINKARIMAKFKDMWDKEEVFKLKEQLFNLIDSIRWGNAELPEWEIDNILKWYDLDKIEFNNFLQEVSEANNKKIVNEYINSTKFNTEKILKWLSEADVKKFNSSKAFRAEVIANYENNLDEFFRWVDKDFKAWLVDTKELVWDELAKAEKFNKSLIDERDSLFTNYIISKYLLNEKFALENYDEFIKLVQWELPRYWEASIFDENVIKQTKDEFNQVKNIIEKKFWTKVVLDKDLFDKNIWKWGKEYMTSWGIVYWYAKWGQIYINPDFARSQTLVHEATHLWYDLAAKNNTQLIDRWNALAKEWIESNTYIAETFDAIKAKYQWLSEVELYEELLTHMSEQRFLDNLKSMDTTLYAKIKDFFREIYRAIHDFVSTKAFVEIGVDDIPLMEINDFVELVNRDLLDPNFKLIKLESKSKKAVADAKLSKDLWGLKFQDVKITERTEVENRYWFVNKFRIETELWWQATIFMKDKLAILDWIFAPIKDWEVVRWTKTYENVLKRILDQWVNSVRITEPTNSSLLAIKKLMWAWILKVSKNKFKWFDLVYDIDTKNLYESYWLKQWSLRFWERKIWDITNPDKLARERFNIPTLKKIWEWSDRVVFDLDENRVLKVAKTDRGLYQNAAADFYLAREWVLPDIYEIGENYVVMQKAKWYKSWDAKEKRLVNEFMKDMWDISPKWYTKRFWYWEKEQAILEKWGWDALLDYDLDKFGWWDVAKRNLWIIDWRIVLIDEWTVWLLDTLISTRDKPISQEFRDIVARSKQLKTTFWDTDKFNKFSLSERYEYAKWAVNEQVINSIDDIAQLRELLFLYLPAFKDKKLFTAFRNRVDELNYGKSKKWVDMIKKMEKYHTNKTKVIDDMAKNTKKIKKEAESKWVTDTSSMMHSILSYVSWKQVEWDLYFYNKEYPMSDWATVVQDAYKEYFREFSIEIWDIKVIDEWDIKDWMNVVVENLNKAKLVENKNANIIKPELAWGWIDHAFFVENWKLYLWALNERLFLDMIATLDYWDVPYKPSGLKMNTDVIIDFYKARYWDNYAKAKDLIDSITNWDNLTDKLNFIEQIEKSNPNFEVTVTNKWEFFDNLPDNIDYYYNKALELWAYYWIKAEDLSKPTEFDMKALKLLYADIALVEWKELDWWTNLLINYLSIFGHFWNIVDDVNITTIHMKAVDSIMKDWFYLPMWLYAETFLKLSRWEVIWNDTFVTTFINKNKAKINELEWFTDIDKVKSYLTKKLEEAKKKTAPWFEILKEELSYNDTWIYFKRVTNKYIDSIAENLDLWKATTSTKTIAEDFDVLNKLFDQYYVNVKAMLESWNASEYDMFREAKRAWSAVAAYEEKYLLPRYQWVLRNRDILTKRYSLIKIWKIEDLPILKESIEKLKEQTKSIVDIWDIDTKVSLADNWYVFIKETSVHIDELINAELRKASWEISQLRQVDLDWISNADKYKIYQNLKWANLLKNTGNLQAKIYEKVFPSLQWFFKDFKLTNYDWIELPRILWQINTILFVDWDSVIDKLIKQKILEDISPMVREWTLTRDSLEKRVTVAVDEYYTWDKNISEKFVKWDVYKAYVEAFSPYELLVKIPQKNIDDYQKWLMRAYENLQPELFESVIVNIDWVNKNLNSVTFDFEKTFPKVIYWEQKFWKEPLDAFWEAYVKKSDERFRLLKDDIDQIDEDIIWMWKNFFNTSAIVLEKSPRLKRFKEVLLAWANYAETAGKFISKIKNKEELMATQRYVADYMKLDEQAFQKIRDLNEWFDDFMIKSWDIANYFRYLNKNLPDTVTDEWVKKIFWNTEKKFLSFKLWDDELNIKWLWVAVKTQKIFSYVDYNGSRWRFWQKRGWLWANSQMDDPDELKFFNKIFDSNLSSKDFQTVMLAHSEFQLNWWLDKVSNRLKSFLTSNWVLARANRLLTSYPYWLFMLHHQIFGYSTMKYGMQNTIWDADFTKVNKLRKEVWALTWEIPELSVKWTAEQFTDLVANKLWRGSPKDFKKVSNYLRNENREFLFDAVKDNANNIVDVIYSKSIKNRVFLDAVLNNPLKNFFNIEEFELFLKNASPSEKQAVINSINRKATELFEWVMWFKNQAMFASNYTWWFGNLWSIFESMNWFRSGWWMNQAKRAFSKFFKAWEIGVYLVKNKFSKEAIENWVEYFSKDRDMQIFFSQILWDAYYATKLKRFVDTRSEEEQNEEDFFDFIGNELTDRKWWNETFLTLSQWAQALYSAWPLRPFIFSVEAAMWVREWSVTSAFMEWLRTAAFRQFKLLNNLTNAWAKLIWESKGDWIQQSLGWLFQWEWEISQIIWELMYNTSAWTLRYIMNDRDYQKNLYYVKDSFDAKEVFMWLNTNPYLEAEQRFQRIALEKNVEQDLWGAMKDLLYWTYLGKFANSIYYPLKYWFDRTNLRSKEEFQVALESNPLYKDYMDNWILELDFVPYEYQNTVLKNWLKALTNSWYMPWLAKQVDSMTEYLQKWRDEAYREKIKWYWWASYATLNIYDFIWRENVAMLLDKVKDLDTKDYWAKSSDKTRLQQELVYNFIKASIDSVSQDKKPYWYHYLDLGYYLTRPYSKKWMTTLDTEIYEKTRFQKAINVFSDRNAFELEQAIYKDTRDDLFLKTLYYSDTELFKPFFTVTEWEYQDKVNFDSWYKDFFVWMNQVLMAASEDNLDWFEVAFSSLIKKYKDKPEAAIAVYNELNKFLVDKDIDNRDEMLNWFLIRNSELLEDMDLLKTRIWEDQYNELLFNIKKREDEIKDKLNTDPSWQSWWRGKLKSSDAKLKQLPVLKKISWEWVAPGSWKWYPVMASKTWPRWYRDWWETKPKFWSYSAKSVDIYWRKTKDKSDIKRDIKAIKRKILKDKALWLT